MLRCLAHILQFIKECISLGLASFAILEHIMVSRDEDLRNGQSVDEISGGSVLLRPGALGDVAADDHEIGPKLVQVVDQCLGDRHIDSSEVQIGNVRDGGHRESMRDKGGGMKDENRISPSDSPFILPPSSFRKNVPLGPLPEYRGGIASVAP